MYSYAISFRLLLLAAGLFSGVASAQEDPAILPSLRSIRIEEANGDDEPVPYYATDGSISPAGAAAAALEAGLARFINQPLHLSTLDDIRGTVVRAFGDSGEGLVRAAVPEQDVTNGDLRILFARGRVGVVTATGNRYFRDATYVDAVRHRPGDPVDTEQLLADVDWLTRNPYRTVSAVYGRGEAFGEVDIELVVREQRPWTIFAGYDREGTTLLGEDRWVFGATSGNFLGHDHRVTYQYYTNAEFDTFHGHFGSYLIPLPWRHEFRLLGFYTDSDVQLDLGEFGVFDLGGESWQATGDYLIPIPRIGKLKSDLVFGFDFKSSNSDLVFGGLRVSDTTTEILQFRAGYEGRLPDDLGVTAFSLDAVFSPGDLSNHNRDDTFTRARAGASADYFYAKANLDRRWDFLPAGFTLRTDVEAQASDANLLASEQFILSGDSAVRGYERSLIRGDHGVVTTVQLNAPPLRQNLGGLPSEWVPFGFWDHGWGRSVDRLPGEPDDFQLSSAGLGLAGFVGRYLDVSAAYGWQLSESGFDDGENGRWHLSVTARW